jgi:hypothetical protein
MKSKPNKQMFEMIEHSKMIQFAGQRMTWSFPWAQLHLAVLKANPFCRDPQKQPPQELTFHFCAAEVTLFGWHLDLMLNPIATQKISHVWTAKKLPAKRTAGVTFIAETFVLPLAKITSMEAKSAAPQSGTHQNQP